MSHYSKFSIWHMLAVLQRRVSTRQDQYYKTNLLNSMDKVGEGVMLNGRSTIICPRKVILENNVHIGDNAYIRADGGLHIGANTHISRNLVLYTCNHEYLGACLPYDENLRLRPVRIHQNVWIGMNVVILPGSEIGEGVIIGAGSVVGGKVAPLSIVGAPLAREIGRRDESHYTEKQTAGAYGGVNGLPL